MRYLITGGAGFIGSNFVRYLYNHYPQESFSVVVLDNFGYSANHENLIDFKDKPNFQLIKGDINNEELIQLILPNIDIVVNFAAEVSVDRSLKDKDSFIKTDIMGVKCLLDSIREVNPNINKFIQISTDEVYGQIKEGSFSEESVLNPRNPYSASKAGGERLAYSYFASYNLPIIITRASNTYGPWAYPEKVIPLFITNLLDGAPVPVFGDGSQVRDWLYVDDHCSGIDTVLHKGTNGEVYNIGGGQEYTNLELTKMILRFMNLSEEHILFVNDRPGHDFRYSIDTQKLERLGWTPSKNLETGLKETINWYKQHSDYWKPLKENLDQKYISGYWGRKED